MTTPVKVSDLKDQIGMNGPRPFLMCYCCGAEYSANKGDYFMHPSDHTFECCDEPMVLVIKYMMYAEVRL
jgi:hypothetical protein